MLRRKLVKNHNHKYTTTQRVAEYRISPDSSEVTSTGQNGINDNDSNKKTVKAKSIIIWLTVLFVIFYLLVSFALSHIHSNHHIDDNDNLIIIPSNPSLRSKDKSLISVSKEKSVNASKDIGSLIKKNMKTRLELLPSPPWPQLDHRTAEAIASGFVLGLENCTEFNFDHTIGKCNLDLW